MSEQGKEVRVEVKRQVSPKTPLYLKPREELPPDWQEKLEIPLRWRVKP